MNTDPAPRSTARTRRRLVTAAVTAAAAATGCTAAIPLLAPAAQASEPWPSGWLAARACSPSGLAVGYSDALDKQVVDGLGVGGLSDLAFDARSRSFVSTVDNDEATPARLYQLGPDPLAPAVTQPGLVLRRADGTPYTGEDSDNEGLAVLPDGDYLVSSETEPSLRIYGRDGVQHGELPVPPRFQVAPDGEATDNATLEGLTISPSGDVVVAAMEGTLSGDLPVSGGEGLYRRFLVYERHGGAYSLLKQVAYQVDPGMRIPEVAAYDDGSLLVEEASYAEATGNAVRLYAVTGLGEAPDVTDVADLASAPTSVVAPKTLVSDLVTCPSLGASALEPQVNPLLDNIEGMAVELVDGAHQGRGGEPGQRTALVWLVSDDNGSPTQTTRLLTLVARLP